MRIKDRHTYRDSNKVKVVEQPLYFFHNLRIHIYIGPKNELVCEVEEFDKRNNLFIIYQTLGASAIPLQ